MDFREDLCPSSHKFVTDGRISVGDINLKYYTIGIFFSFADTSAILDK